MDLPEDPRTGPLADFPLRREGLAEVFETPPADPAEWARSDAAPLSARAASFAADAAATSLAVTLALLAAVISTGRAPRLMGLPWAAVFAVYFSFFFVVTPLILFGRTVGMALAGLSAFPAASGRRLTPSEAIRRWAGTAFCAAALGIPLFFTLRDRERPTPADRLSGRPLTRDVES